MKLTAKHKKTFISQDFEFKSIAEAKYHNPCFYNWREVSQ